MKKPVDVVMPYLVNSGQKACFIEYRCFYPVTNKLERFRIYKGLSKCSTETDLKSLSDQIIEKYSGMLRSGWRPWNDNSVIYQDETEYHNIASFTDGKRRDKNHIRRFFSEFLTYKKSDVSPRTYETYQSKIRRFQIWLEKNNYGDLLLSQITNEIVIRYFHYLIDKEKLDSITVKNYRMLIAAMFTYFADKKLIIANPVHNLPKATKRVDNAARPLTNGDIRKYLKYVSENDPQLFLASMFSFFLLTRPVKELRLMKVQDLDIARKLAYIPDDHAKMRKRVVTISQVLCDLIDQYMITSFPPESFIFGKEGTPGPVPVSKNHFNRKFRIIRDYMKLSQAYKFYSFKHTGAGELLESGATLAELMNQLGHTSFESTIHYVRRHFGEKSQKVINLRPEFLKGII